MFVSSVDDEVVFDVGMGWSMNEGVPGGCARQRPMEVARQEAERQWQVSRHRHGGGRMAGRAAACQRTRGA